jgi:hypothetical protein
MNQDSTTRRRSNTAVNCAKVCWDIMSILETKFVTREMQEHADHHTRITFQIDTDIYFALKAILEDKK